MLTGPFNISGHLILKYLFLYFLHKNYYGILFGIYYRRTSKFSYKLSLKRSFNLKKAGAGFNIEFRLEYQSVNLIKLKVTQPRILKDEKCSTLEVSTLHKNKLMIITSNYTCCCQKICEIIKLLSQTIILPITNHI